MTLEDLTAKARKTLEGVYDIRERENVIDLLIEEHFNIPKHRLRLNMQEDFNHESTKEFMHLLERLKKNEPVQYVLGFSDFYGMKMKVNKHVLIPRPETEELVGHVIKQLGHLSKKCTLSILDIGTGSGCIAIALKKYLPSCKVTGIDVSEEAIGVAIENATKENSRVDFFVKDFLSEKNWSSLEIFDVIISNPPYVTEAEFQTLTPRVKNFEPRKALIAEDRDSFIFYNKIAVFGKTHLRKGGRIFLELNSSYSKAIKAVFKVASYHTAILNDMQGNERILDVQKP